MLGRKAALVGSVVVLAIGGGTALAATHASSQGKTPAKPLVKPQKQLQLQKQQRRGEHHCKHESQVSPADV